MSTPLRQTVSTIRSSVRVQCRRYSTPAPTPLSPPKPRHLLSISDLSRTELITLIRNAALHKNAMKSGFASQKLVKSLVGKTIAMSFSKRSTRTRVSTEAAVVAMGGHPMFLGKEDIQLGVNESLRDTATVLSSMVSGLVARVGPHSDVADLAKYSTVPVINALSDRFHPLQTIADFLTIYEVLSSGSETPSSLGLEGLKIAWVGDANNVLYDLAIGARKLGVDLAIATPRGYSVPNDMKTLINQAGQGMKEKPGVVTMNHSPQDAIKDAHVIVTDTWISMGQEEEAKERQKAFKGYQVTSELAQLGGAHPEWKFMHCLPRHPEEVSDEVFYGPRSLVFQEAENRLWAAISALEAFVIENGRF